MLAIFQEERQSGPFGDDGGYSAPLTRQSQINKLDDEFGGNEREFFIWKSDDSSAGIPWNVLKTELQVDQIVRQMAVFQLFQLTNNLKVQKGCFKCARDNWKNSTKRTHSHGRPATDRRVPSRSGTPGLSKLVCQRNGGESAGTTFVFAASLEPGKRIRKYLTFSFQVIFDVISVRKWTSSSRCQMELFPTFLERLQKML